MSSVRGATPRGRGRGSPSPAPRGRGQSRSRGLNNTSRGTPKTRSSFGQASRQTIGSAPRLTTSSRGNAVNTRPAQRGAFGVASTRGSWQDRYQALTTTRERERSDAIRQGLIADPDKPRSLSEAITPVGTCQDMCAEYERVQRVVQKDVWDEETDPNQSPFAITEKEPDESRMVKKFRRAAAGLEEQLPSDLRPPHVLKKTCDYLFEDVIGNAQSLAKVHHFVWDRTRAIRNDFSIQQVTRPDELRIAVECFERIARFHIVSLHQLALPEKPYSKYDWQQEREQLDRTLLSLMQFYDDCRGRIQLPNEAEFRAYCVIFQLQDPTPDLEDRVQTWPRHVILDARVRKAMDLYMAACNVMDAQGPLKPRANHLIARQDWQAFWTLVASKEVSYLMGCVGEIYFNLVRRTVLNALFRTFRMNSISATPDWTVDALCDLLAFDDGDEVYAYCEQFGFTFKEREDGQHYLDLTSVKGRTLPEPTGATSKQSKSSLVEDKRFGRTLSAVINGLAVKQAQDIGMVINSEDDEGMEDVGMDGNEDTGLFANGIEIDDGESLFIPERGPPAPSVRGPVDDPSQRKSSFFGGLSSGPGFGKPPNFGEQPNPFSKLPPNVTTTSTTPSSFGMATSKIEAVNAISNGAGSTSTAASAPSLFRFSTTPIENDTTKYLPHPKGLSFGGPSQDQKSVFASAPAAKSSLFSFTVPPAAQTSEQNEISNNVPSTPILTNLGPKTDPKTTLEQKEHQFTFGEPPAPSVTQAPLPSFQTQFDTHSPPPQPQFTAPTPATSNSNTAPSPSTSSLGAKRTSFSADTKPRKPSPLSNSFTANEDNSAIANGSLDGGAVKFQTQPFTDKLSHTSQPPIVNPSREFYIAPEPASEDFDATLTRLADEFINDPCRGFLKQYVDFAVDKTIKEVKERVETERLNAEADELRVLLLQRRVIRRLKESFWRKRIAKSGRERRERRQRRLHQQQSGDLEEGSRYLDNQSVEGSSQFGSVAESEGQFDNSHGMESALAKQTSYNSRQNGEPAKVAGNKRPMSSHGSSTHVPSRESGHKRLKSTSHIDERGRIAKPTVTSHPNAELLKRSSFLGFAVHSDAPNDQLKNTTTTNYFKLKAMGIDSASGLRGTKRRSESIQTASQTSPPALRSSVRSGSSPVHSSSKALMPPPSTTLSRTYKTSDEDEALFARLQTARQSLSDSAAILKLDMTEIEERRLSISSQSSNESPSMAKARAEARLRASNPPSENGASRIVPAYRLRESRFVPREHYSRAIERSRDFRESRSRDTSRPESPFKPTSTLSTSLETPATKQPVSVSSRGVTQLNENRLHQPRINGISKPLETQTETPASKPNPFSFQSRDPVSFADHNTQMSSQNPFLSNTVPDSHDSIAHQPPPGFMEYYVGDQIPLDQTIRPSEINRSLEKSFGSSYGSNHQPVVEVNPTPPEQDSYMHSQAISLLSDDEDEAPVQSQSYQQPHNQYVADEETNELLNETVDDGELGNSYGHFNQFDASADRSEYFEDEKSQEWENEIEPPAEHDEYSRGDDYSSEGNEDANGYEYEEGEGVDADIEDEDELDEGQLQRGFSDEEGGDYDTEIDEDEEGGYDEDDEEDDVPQYRQYDPRWAAPPPKNPELQHVGNSVEEAIELSD